MPPADDDFDMTKMRFMAAEVAPQKSKSILRIGRRRSMDMQNVAMVLPQLMKMKHKVRESAEEHCCLCGCE